MGASIKSPVYAPKVTAEAAMRHQTGFTPELLKGLLYSALGISERNGAGSKKNAKALNPPDKKHLYFLFSELQNLRQEVKVIARHNAAAIKNIEATKAAISTIQQTLLSRKGAFHAHAEALENAICEDGEAAYSAMANQATGKKLREYRDLVDKITGLVDGLNELEADPRLALIIPSNHFVIRDRWQHILPDIIRAYRQAMQSSNPGNDIKIDAKGPGGRFISLVIPYLTSEEATPAAVAKWWRQTNTPG